jgi:hypothetical protein
LFQAASAFQDIDPSRELAGIHQLCEAAQLMQAGLIEIEQAFAQFPALDIK